MEIDFMILWKEKAKTNDDILSRVKNMLNKLFDNISDYDITYTYNKTDNILPYKISKDNNNIVYLKVECNSSEAKAANILSSFKNILCNGKHREDFSIICTLDEASLSFCCRLMKYFGIFERRLREIMYLSTVKAFGSHWVKETFTDELYYAIKEKTKGKNDEKITELALEYLDYNEIISYLFEKRELVSREEILNNELSEENLQYLNHDEIIASIRKMRLESLWNKLFKRNKSLQLTESDLRTISKYRNDVMHHHDMDQNQYKQTYTMIKKMNNQLNCAIEKMEEKIYTKEEYESVFANIGLLISGFIDFAGLVTRKVENLSTVLGKLAQRLTDVIPDFSKTIGISTALNNAFLQPINDEIGVLSSAELIPDNSGLKILPNLSECVATKIDDNSSQLLQSITQFAEEANKPLAISAKLPLISDDMDKSLPTGIDDIKSSQSDENKEIPPVLSGQAVTDDNADNTSP